MIASSIAMTAVPENYQELSSNAKLEQRRKDSNYFQLKKEYLKQTDCQSSTVLGGSLQACC